jgi:ABC-type sugar transport system ATPase subunit
VYIPLFYCMLYMNLKQKSAILMQKRDAFINAYSDAQLKRAENVKEIKEFATVIKFLDQKMTPVAEKRKLVATEWLEIPVLKQVFAQKKKDKVQEVIKYNSPEIGQPSSLSLDFGKLPSKYKRIK